MVGTTPIDQLLIGAEGTLGIVTKIIVPKDLNEDESDIVHSLQAKHPVDARKDVKW